ncbi:MULTISPECIES: hypothetical protein [Kosmotoga]|jgi:hypothetical protein|uniref:Uncharacterized protein n=1 Tax=Kosmotoga olearia (strain ATCC BAA-1733 / DSM 21960 / TBF 19.5.1) TaxID=521045 RepID=C5CEK7_KOSOT|nr:MULTISPECIES: hypothetical protein [Kosmotoga]ACR79253.1 hypothetical protein Kole_0533 [Kosmotoga olearia TBF 19.5.1]MDI3524408.1 hypothetical protein [Kosmotoga sp.]MDK2954124.1 hypothetical protein [Kosmotoga sp.]
MEMENSSTPKSLDEGLIKALQSAIQKAPIRNGGKIYLTDIWVITSLPEDMIIELFRRNQFALPEGVLAVVDDRRRRKKVIYDVRETKTEKHEENPEETEDGENGDITPTTK